MIAYSSRQARWLRIAALIWGVAVFLWLAPEDDSAFPAVLLGFGFAALLITSLILRMATEGWLRSWRIVLAAAFFGALLGAGTSLSAVLLMLLKNARHAHLYPDYPPDVLLAALARFPDWSLAGALLGLGWVCLRWARFRQRVNTVTESKCEIP